MLIMVLVLPETSNTEGRARAFLMLGPLTTLSPQDSSRFARTPLAEPAPPPSLPGKRVSYRLTASAPRRLQLGQIS